MTKTQPEPQRNDPVEPVGAGDPAVPDLPESLAEGLPELVDGQVELASGVWLPVTRCLRGTPRFVLVHGLSSNRRLWAGVMRELGRQGIGSIAIDLRCHGEAPCPPGALGIPTAVADLADLIRGERLDRPVVVGQSWGGNIVVQLGAAHPTIVRGVAGVDGGAIQLSDRFPTWEACAEVLAPPDLSGLTLDTARSMFEARHPDWEPWAIDASLANFRPVGDCRVTPRLTRARHMEILRDLWGHRPMDLYPRLAVPLLLLLAVSPGRGPSHDRAEIARKAERAGAGAHVEWFEPADHDLHAQQPGAVASALLRHFGAVVPAP